MNIPATNATSTLIAKDSSAKAAPLSSALPEEPASSTATKATDSPLLSRKGDQTLEQELSDANRMLTEAGSEIRFQYDPEASRLIVRLVAVNTNEVLRQFPSDEALQAARLIKSGKPHINTQA